MAPGFAVGVVLVCIAGCSQQVEVSAPPAIEGETRSYTFLAEDEGKMPDRWKMEQTGKGPTGRWQVVAGDTAPSGTGYVLAQLAESPRSVFNLCVLEKGKYADLKLSVALKPVEGQVDQGGGLVWRYIDANNYYVCRFNPLEDNVRVYKVIAGNRKQLASADVKLASGQWHTLTAAMKGDLIVCTIGDVQVAVRDDALVTPGQTGLWTKADARTRFDAFSVTASHVGADVNDEEQATGDDVVVGGPWEDASGTIEGTVRFTGEVIPEATKVSVSADLDFCGADHSLEDYVIDPTSRGVRYVIVRLSGGTLKNWPEPKTERLVLDNNHCRFEPHAAVMTVGSTIECVNSDPIFHTTHAYFGESFNFALSQKGSSATHTMILPGMTQIRCDKHGWMNSFIWVGRHPFHAVTDAQGNFRIADVPPGEYTIHLWHERFGEHRQPIAIQPGKTTSEHFSYPVAEQTNTN